MGFSLGGGIILSFLINNPNLNIAGVIPIAPLLYNPNNRKLTYI